MKSKILSDDNGVVFSCILGESAIDNWNILKHGSQKDIFFHLDNYPSCYVILKTYGNNPSFNIIRLCAEWCKNETKYKNIPNIYIIYTELSNVLKGKKIGEVSFKNQKKLNRIRI